MNLTSCDNCGVVLDLNKLDFPVDIYDDNGTVNEEFAEWAGYEFAPKTKCPICGESILKEEF